MPPLLDLFLAALVIGLAVFGAYDLARLAARGVAALAHAIRWHVYRPLLRRRYLRRVGNLRDAYDREAAMRRHPAGSALEPDAHNHSLS